MSKTILITGASSGLGKATAKLFQTQGWNVIATMRNLDKETELNKLNNVLVVKLDVLDADSINDAVNLGIETFGKIDVLVNNAGYGAYGPLEAFSKEKINRQFNTNVIGLLHVTQALLPHFRRNKNGIIINVSSAGGKVGLPLGTLYHGTKFAVEGLSEALYYEVQQFGGKVKIIEPGGITTDFTTRSIDISNDETMTEYQPFVRKVLTAFDEMFKNVSSAESVAAVILKAATDGKNQLRYQAGKDAKTLLSIRKLLGDKLFMSQIIKRAFKI
jgi:NAD(P)-dependent dehydrogenase (short-subunit alcohol dehydrogenase family)